MIKALFLSSLVLNSGLLLGRLSGFVREAFVAATFGATSQADIVVLMLTVPDLLVSILMGGAMGAILVPEFSQFPEQARRLLYQSLCFFGILFLVIAVGLHWQANTLVNLLAPGFTASKVIEAGVALGWVIWLIPITILTGVVTAFLHAQNKFAVPAIGTFIINSSIITGLLLIYYDYGSLFLVAFFVLLGGLIRLISQLLLLCPVWAPITGFQQWRLTKSLIIRYGQAMFSGSLLLLFPVIARALASFQGEGSVALFNYATRLVEFPLAIAVTFLAVVFFPRIAQSFTGDPRLHRLLVRYGLQLTIGLSLVAATTLISFSATYAEIVYSHGQMLNSDVMLVSKLTTIGLIALPLQGFAIFLTTVFNARRNTRTPLMLNGAGLLFFLLLSKSEVFGSDLQALMWGMVASYGLICMLQLMFLRIEAFTWRHVLLDKMFCSGVICAVIISAGACQWIANIGLPSWISLFVASFFALLSLFVMALFYEEFRSCLKIRMRAK